jgi:hypothetical protein
VPGFFVVDMVAEEFFYEGNATTSAHLQEFLVRVADGQVPARSQGGVSWLVKQLSQPLVVVLAIAAVVGVVACLVPRNSGPRSHEE